MQNVFRFKFARKANFCLKSYQVFTNTVLEEMGAFFAFKEQPTCYQLAWRDVAGCVKWRKKKKKSKQRNGTLRVEEFYNIEQMQQRL